MPHCYGGSAASLPCKKLCISYLIAEPIHQIFLMSMVMQSKWSSCISCSGKEEDLTAWDSLAYTAGYPACTLASVPLSRFTWWTLQSLP